MKRVGFRVTATFIAVFLVLFTASTAVESYAQSWGYAGNRIAISADGNSAPDDGHHWKTGDPDWERAGRFFGKILGLTFAVGVATLERVRFLRGGLPARALVEQVHDEYRTVDLDPDHAGPVQ